MNEIEKQELTNQHKPMNSYERYEQYKEYCYIANIKPEYIWTYNQFCIEEDIRGYKNIVGILKKMKRPNKTARQVN